MGTHSPRLSWACSDPSYPCFCPIGVFPVCCCVLFPLLIKTLAMLHEGHSTLHWPQLQLWVLTEFWTLPVSCVLPLSLVRISMRSSPGCLNSTPLDGTPALFCPFVRVPCKLLLWMQALQLFLVSQRPCPSLDKLLPPEGNVF